MTGTSTEIRSIAQRALGWTPFQKGHPQLGQDIDVMLCGEPNHAGVVTHLIDLGSSWLSITTKKYVNMAVRPDYLWREHPKESKS